ncbi:ribosome maturation factor RimP [Brachybacterium sp. YJGR34]|uniref:ribosome maturation factor RimP n=1 Tax=Brachybacterium sp. YJGR34 TaxID=2059911 RepID=UPI000E0ABD85|nr:ribosome assembly cofactor RimP [Brachybacterium sp. YJGR34]
MSALDDQTILREAAGRVLDAHGLVLEEIEVRRGGGAPEVRLVVDLPGDALGSADLDTVADASRELSDLVDEDDALLGPDPVVLEVTTPGADRELTAPRHFRRSRGRLLSLTTTDGTVLRARLLGVEDERLRLRQEPGRDDRGRPRRRPAGTDEHLELPLAEVSSARVEIEFDPPADLAQLIAEAGTTASKES